MTQQAQKNSVVEALPPSLPAPGIPDADGSGQIGPEQLLGCMGVPSGEGVAEGVQPGRVLVGFLLKPVQNLFRKNLTDLPVGDGQLEGAVLPLPPLGKVSGGEEDAPKVADVLV